MQPDSYLGSPVTGIK